MKTLWHIAKKDLLRFRWLILAWIVFQAAIILLVSSVSPGDFGNPTQWLLKMFFDVGRVLPFIIGCLLVVLIMREDPLTESEVFWVTRPISGLTLLQSKILTIVVAVLLPPIFVGIPWWLYCGFGLLDILGASFHFALVYLHITALGLCFGVFATRRRKATTMSFATALMIILAVLAPIVRFLLSADSTGFPFGLAESRLLLCDLIALVTVAAMTAHQFITRRNSRSITIGLVGAAVIAVVLNTWPLNFVAWYESLGAKPATIKGEFSTFADLGDANAKFAQVQGKLFLPGNQLSKNCEVLEGRWEERGVSFPISGRIQAVDKLIDGEKRFRGLVAERIASGVTTDLVQQDSVLGLNVCGEFSDGAFRSQKLPPLPAREADVEALVLCPIWEGKVDGVISFGTGGCLSSDGIRTHFSAKKSIWPLSYEVHEWMPAQRSEWSEYVIRERSTGRVIREWRQGYGTSYLHGVSLKNGSFVLGMANILPPGVYGTDESIRIALKGLDLVRVVFREKGRQLLPLRLHLTSNSPSTVTKK